MLRHRKTQWHYCICQLSLCTPTYTTCVCKPPYLI